MTSGIQQPSAVQGSVLSAAGDVFNVLFEPAAVFNRIKEKPRIIIPWLVISVLLIVLTIITRPYYDAAMAALKASLPPAQAARMGGGGLVGRLIGVPVFLLLGAAIGAGLLWIGVSLSAAQASYKTTLSVLMHCNITYVLFAAVSLAVLMVRGVEAVGGIADLRPPLGLDLLAPNASLFTGSVLNAINPLSIWAVWLCGTGLSITQRVSKSSGIVITAVSYLVCVVLQSAPLLFLKTS